jgi:U3 small nucleolar RNA-associated protein 11
VLDKNPEEFHFHMFGSQLKDGVHYDLRKDDNELTKDELKLIQTQDLNYVNHKRVIEMNKIEKLKQNLHLIDVQNKIKNRHTFFVDNKSDKKNFDFAKQMKTNKELLEMGFNFGKSDDLRNKVFANVNETDIQNVTHLRDKSYKELAKRMERHKFLKILSQKMELKKKLLVSHLSFKIMFYFLQAFYNI